MLTRLFPSSSVTVTEASWAAAGMVTTTDATALRSVIVLSVPAVAPVLVPLTTATRIVREARGVEPCAMRNFPRLYTPVAMAFTPLCRVLSLAGNPHQVLATRLVPLEDCHG